MSLNPGWLYEQGMKPKEFVDPRGQTLRRDCPSRNPQIYFSSILFIYLQVAIYRYVGVSMVEKIAKI